jgi:DNA-binding FadR family transcriptional regulator
MGITFRLFVFSIIGRGDDTPNAASERIAAVQQHLAILEGIRSGDPKKARRAFVQNTVRYWNEQYGLKLVEEELKVDAGASDRV